MSWESFENVGNLPAFNWIRVKPTAQQTNTVLPAAAWEMKIITHSKTETLLHSLKGILSQVRNISVPCKIIFKEKSFREVPREI